MGGILAPVVAEQAISLILALTRSTVKHHNRLSSGNWKVEDFWKFQDQIETLNGKNLGIIGYGRIGKEIGRLAKAFRMNILAIRAHPVSDTDVDFMGGPDMIEHVLSNSDIIVLAVPYTKETYRMIGEIELNLMRETSYLINVSRGQVIDETSLYGLLKENKIAGAGLDVFENEPLDPVNPILKLPNVVVTPHAGGAWKASAPDRCKLISENIKRVMSGKTPLNLIDLNIGY